RSRRSTKVSFPPQAEDDTDEPGPLCPELYLLRGFVGRLAILECARLHCRGSSASCPSRSVPISLASDAARNHRGCACIPATLPVACGRNRGSSTTAISLGRCR